MKMVEILKRISKTVGGLLAAAVVFLAIVISFGTDETRYKCTGSLVKDSKANDALLFLRVEYFRWFVLWADRDGTIWSEIPNIDADLFFDVRKIGDTLMFSSSVSKAYGTLSMLSHSVRLDGRMGRFDGMCSRIETNV